MRPVRVQAVFVGSCPNWFRVVGVDGAGQPGGWDRSALGPDVVAGEDIVDCDDRAPNLTKSDGAKWLPGAELVARGMQASVRAGSGYRASLSSCGCRRSSSRYTSCTRGQGPRDEEVRAVLHPVRAVRRTGAAKSVSVRVSATTPTARGRSSAGATGSAAFRATGLTSQPGGADRFPLSTLKVVTAVFKCSGHSNLHGSPH
jgi:hypothetical protein